MREKKKTNCWHQGNYSRLSQNQRLGIHFFLKKDLWTDRKKWMRIIYINNMWQTQGEVTTDWGQFNFKGLERYSRQLSSLVPWESDWWPLYILGAKFQCEVIDILIIYLGKDPEPFPRNHILKWAGTVYFSRMETSSGSKGKRSKTVICLIDFFPKPLWHEYVPQTDKAEVMVTQLFLVSANAREQNQLSHYYHHFPCSVSLWGLFHDMGLIPT